MSRESTASADSLWRVVERIGGRRGYPGLPLVWDARALIDRAVGGVGGSRGRADPDHLEAGDVVDWWRVEQAEAGRVVLRAEMKMPGTARLEFRVTSGADGGSRLDQTVTFEPAGALGHAYWWAERAGHVVVFSAMLRGIVSAAERE